MYEEDEDRKVFSIGDETQESGDGASVEGDDHRGSESGDDRSHVDECDPDPEIRYWNSVRSNENPVVIGLVTTGRLKRKKGVSINLRFLDYDAIIAAIRRQREQQGSSRDSEGGFVSET